MRGLPGSGRAYQDRRQPWRTATVQVVQQRSSNQIIGAAARAATVERRYQMITFIDARGVI
jgi:hypothetical protein